MTPPAKGQVDNLTWHGNRVESFQGFQNHDTLLFDVARFTQWMAKGPAQEDRARWLHLLGELTHDRYPDGGDAGFLYFSLDQSHGLIADTSGRGQQDDVDLVLPEFSDHLFCRLFDQGGDMATVNMAHERIVRAGQSANDAFLL